jgi:hypothetical protein
MRDYARERERLKAQNLCSVRFCLRPNWPFCSYHTHLYRHPGEGCYEFYLRLHTGLCPYCAVPVPRPVTCDNHLREFRRRVDMHVGRTARPEKFKNAAHKADVWTMYGPPIHARAWEWPL